MRYNCGMKTKPLTFEQENKIVMSVIKNAKARYVLVIVLSFTVPI